MHSKCRSITRVAVPWAACLFVLAGCGGGGTDVDMRREEPLGRPVDVADHGENMVWTWSRLTAATIGYGAAPRVTPEERRPHWAPDHASVHVAIYDAVMAIAGTHEPFAVRPTLPAAGASPDAAVAAAAHGVLKGLFPNFAAVYQPPYDAMLAAIPEGPAKSRGLALGAEVAAGVLALRANDGRWTPVTPFAPTRPGDYRGFNAIPLAPWFGSVRPFALASASQFRPDGPPALTSASYTEDFNQTKDWGRSDSALRSAEETGAAWFHAELANLYWPRNLRRFARSQVTLAENARLMALLWVTVSDAAIGCFEAKYHFLRWRTIEAVPLADTDGNDQTVADASWTQLLPASNHPEYPAAPGCVVGAVADTLAHFYGTRRLSFTFDSSVANGGPPRHFDSVDAMEHEAQRARVWSGAHFRTSLVHGAVLGSQAARWIARHRFTPLAEPQAQVPTSPGP